MLTTTAQLARSALDAAPDAMIIIDEGAVIRYANRQVSSLFGYHHDDVVGQPVEFLMPERFRGRHVEQRQAYTRNVRFRSMGAGLPLFGRRRDGSEFPVEISLSPIDDSGRLLVAAAIRNVTDRKRIEADLILARQTADDARQMADRARESAERANDAKSRFLAMASHDLRQPLQTLALLSGTLRRTVAERAAAEALAQQEQAIGAMSRLLNALLDISKLESGAIKPDPSDFTVQTLFEELRREFSSVATNKGLSFDVVASETSVHSDPSLVGQILRNLVANALKYTRRGSVAVRSLALGNSLVRIEVLDTGIGIPAEKLRFIYDEFYQVEVPTDSVRDGYGLGLSIVQRLVTLLNLRLDVHSELGKGSVFSLTLPQGRAPVRASIVTPSKPISGLPPAQGRVLLVEDDAAVRNATRMLLNLEGYRVSAVASREEALGEARALGDFDLVVSDFHLTGGDTGTQVIAALREALGRPVKAILMTGDTSKAMENLPPDPLRRIASKPVNADELLQLISELLHTGHPGESLPA